MLYVNCQKKLEFISEYNLVAKDICPTLHGWIKLYDIADTDYFLQHILYVIMELVSLVSFDYIVHLFSQTLP